MFRLANSINREHNSPLLLAMAIPFSPPAVAQSTPRRRPNPSPSPSGGPAGGGPDARRLRGQIPRYGPRLKRLVEEGAWFVDAAYPYAATETCVGHATISTGAFPAPTHGRNVWWTAKKQKMVHLHRRPGSSVKNPATRAPLPKGADTAWRNAVPSFAEN